MSTSPQDILKYGHIAAALRQFMVNKGFATARDLNEFMGLPRDHASVYNWLAARGAPNPAMRKKLAKLTGIPARTLTMNTEANGHDRDTIPQATVVERGKPRPNEFLTVVTVTNDGNARLRLDAIMPLDMALEIAKTVSEHNLNEVKDEPENV